MIGESEKTLQPLFAHPIEKNAPSKFAPPAARDSEILNLQFLRGAAALMVVADHLIERLINRGLFSEGIRATAWSLGGIGVATFFVISGFIMVYTTRDKFGKSGAGPAFIRRRITRIAPLYYITTVLVVALTALVNKTSFFPPMAEIASSLAFIPYKNPEGEVVPLYALGWTLEYEMFFYVIFAAAMRFRLAVGLPIITIALCGLVSIGTLLPGFSDGPWIAVVITYFTRPIMLYFVIGMTIAVIFRLIGGPVRTRIPDPSFAWWRAWPS